MAQIAVFTAADGSVQYIQPFNNVYVPVEENPARTFIHLESGIENVTIDGEHKATHRLATIEEIAAKDCPIGADWKIIDDGSLPDNYFRGAWLHDGNGGVSVDMDKAVYIHKNNLRILRSPELSSLDIQYQRATEGADTDTLSAIVARKNALRDVTKNPAIAAATTPDQLKIAGINVINGA